MQADFQAQQAGKLWPFITRRKLFANILPVGPCATPEQLPYSWGIPQEEESWLWGLEEGGKTPRAKGIGTWVISTDLKT